LKKISVSYFPRSLKYASPLLFVAGIYLAVTDSLIWACVLVLLGVIILTTEYVTEIDIKNKQYRDYLSFLTVRLSEDRKHFSRIEKIVISKGNYSETINTRVQSRQLDWSDYTGTLIFDVGSLDLLTRTDKRQLIVGLKKFAEYCDVGIEDQTTGRHYWVDLAKVS
jgi:hypothetical protein